MNRNFNIYTRETDFKQRKRGKSLSGALSKYASVNLIDKEKDVWMKAVLDRL